MNMITGHHISYSYASYKNCLEDVCFTLAFTTVYKAVLLWCLYLQWCRIKQSGV